MIGRPLASLVVVLGSLALAGETPGCAEAALAQDRRPSRPGSRIDRLEAWLAAIEQHVPGTADAPALQVQMWPRASLDQLAVDLAAVINVMADPDFDLYWAWTGEGARRARRTPYSEVDVARLQGLARAAAARGDGNRLLTRAAMLHTDAAWRVVGDGGPRNPIATRPDRVSVFFTDGRQLSVEDGSAHRDLAGRLLDAVTPSPAADDRVRLWYLATASYLQRQEQLDERHMARALELFPEEPDLLFLGGALHERFASPQLQSLARSARVPAGVMLGIDSERSELRQAESLLGRALAIDAALAEARIRRGRVLGLLDRHEEAREELRRALPAAADPLLHYFAELFLGGEADALGEHDQARAAYTRAAALYPRAQSPRLALSLLAIRGADRAAALEAMRPVLELPAEPNDRDDPWWSYHVVQARETDVRLERLYASLDAGDRP